MTLSRKRIFESRDQWKVQGEVAYDAVFNAGIAKLIEKPEIIQIVEQYQATNDFDQRLAIFDQIIDIIRQEESASVISLARMAKRIQDSLDKDSMTSDSWEYLICRILATSLIRAMSKDGTDLYSHSPYESLKNVIYDYKEARLSKSRIKGIE